MVQYENTKGPYLGVPIMKEHLYENSQSSKKFICYKFELISILISLYFFQNIINFRLVFLKKTQQFQMKYLED